MRPALAPAAPSHRSAAGLGAWWFVALLAVLVVVLLGGCSALPPRDAALVWTPLHPAVQRAEAVPVPDSRVHVLRVDLRAPGVRLAVSPPEERGQTLAQMASGQGALLSVNASFFDARFNPLGVTASGGRRWAGVMQPERAPLIGCTAAARCRIELAEPPRDDPSWSEVLGGRPWLVRAGHPRSASDDATCASLCAQTHPRTAVGLDASGRWLYLVLAEGRRPPVAGLTLAQLAAFLHGLGVHDAINLDGGGSSTLLVRGVSAMARPANEPALRRVANALHVFVDEAR